MTALIKYASNYLLETLSTGIKTCLDPVDSAELGPPE
jgi:hypothetical protein